MNKFEWERFVYAQPFNGEAMRVLWCYASHADVETRITFPTIRQVAEETEVSVEKVGKYRRALLDTGWLAESDEKTSRGNPKLVLTVGEDVTEMSYLGEKKAVSPKSMVNLIPAAKQKKAAGSLDTPDEAGLGHRERAGLGNREVEGLDTPDVTIKNNHSRTTSNNQTGSGEPVRLEQYIRRESPSSPNAESTTARSSNVDSRDAAVTVEEPLSEWQAQCKEAEKTFAW